jgi:hypothetical protein
MLVRSRYILMCFSRALKLKYFPLAVSRSEELEAQLAAGNVPCNCAKEGTRC